MQNLYPLFVGDRILKKEMLWAVRDRSFMHLDLEYREYGDGILKGCGVRVENGRIIVEPGMIKYGGFIYLMPEHMRSWKPGTEGKSGRRIRMILRSGR